MDEERIIQLENICFAYPGGSPVLDNLCFTLEKGAKLGLIGHNGSGKTTMLHIIMGLIKPSSGTVRVLGKPAETKKDFLDVRRRIGFLFQDADDQLFCPTVLEDVAFGPLNLGRSPEEARRMASETLESLNLKGFEDRITHRLSGGEKKLVALATVLVMKPDALLLDEPTTGLDEETSIRIIDLLNGLDIGCAIVSHEYDFLARTTRHIYSMQKGRIVYDGDSSTLHSHYH
ncbi:MAG: energy-coupling factor ABC transporter ATP-binding protein, partial [Deltaproteobacteria bacterium]|nr:energy-coupling factor ABC transporter ATP-binding protein [Deltaproteobacteria bacterium]